MRIDLDVLYDEKDDAKNIGASWDFKKRTWYVDDDLIDYDPVNFSKWFVKYENTTNSKK